MSQQGIQIKFADKTNKKKVLMGLNGDQSLSWMQDLEIKMFSRLLYEKVWFKVLHFEKIAT